MNDKSTTIEEIRERLRSFVKERDWEQFHSPKNLSMALIAEAAELVEHFQWLSEEQSHDLDEHKRHQVSMELADILIYLVRTADKLGIDLLLAADKKIDLNETRYPVERVRGSARRASEYTDNN